MLTSSLDMLEESLVKKIDILTRIEDENEKQREVLSSMDEEREAEFDATIDKKTELIDQLGLLDDGFQSLSRILLLSTSSWAHTNCFVS